MSYNSNARFQLLTVLYTVTGIFVLIPPPAPAQQLEEIVVTAQRREQSLQEVPISVEVFSGEELKRQGFRVMDDLANFSPSVEIDMRVQDQDISIRGMGTTGNNLSLEQSAPMFVDGIHFGRTSMIKGAFFDLERIEVLRGPQPVTFGQNAVAGAFNLTTRKPSPTWEGDVTAEFGNFDRKTVEGGIGGPISETLGVRLAVKWDTIDGYMEDILTGYRYPKRKDLSGRAILQWTPNNNFSALAKAEYVDSETAGDGVAICRTPGEPPGTGTTGQPGDLARYVWFPGEVPLWDSLLGQRAAPTKCFTNLGVHDNAPFPPRPVFGVIQEEIDGVVDFNDRLPEILDSMGIALNNGLESFDRWDSQNALLQLNYQMDNGISIQANTGWIDYNRIILEDNDYSPIMTNAAVKAEDFDMWSQEIRVSSARGGMLEWDFGGHYQEEDFREDPFTTIEAGTRRSQRVNIVASNTNWKSVFGAVTFNFLGDKASIDLGARYSEVKKEGYIEGLGATWIFDVNPDPDGDGVVVDINGDVIDDDINVRKPGRPDRPDGENDYIDCSTPDPYCGSYGAGYWTTEWRIEQLADSWNVNPPIAPVAIGPIQSGIRRRGGPFSGTYKSDNIDPQVVLRYRPTPDMSLYAKWATAFKAGGFDSGAGSLPDDDEGFLALKDEFADNWELGAKGLLMGNRLRYDATLFWTETEDLQIATTDVKDGIPQGSESTNAGKQRVRGLELGLTWAATDRFTTSFNGALMDGVMVKFEGAGCTPAEFATADTNECISSAEALVLANGDEDLAEDIEGFIDRSGEKAPRTPDWKFAFEFDYWLPVYDNYKAMMNTNIAFSDGYIDNVEDFDKMIMWNSHTDINFNVGIGDVNDVWRVMFWGRNLLEARTSYNEEYDVELDGLATENMSAADFFTYGVQFQYNFR